jgi:xanthine dehydrogenase molybdopterin-binding subunit B
MLAISVREALRDAVSAFAPAPGEIPLASPATCEAIFMAIQRQRKRAAEAEEAARPKRRRSVTP